MKTGIKHRNNSLNIYIPQNYNKIKIKTIKIIRHISIELNSGYSKVLWLCLYLGAKNVIRNLNHIESINDLEEICNIKKGTENDNQTNTKK